PDQLGLLASALLRAEDHRLPLLPSGEARIATLGTHAFKVGGDEVKATLHAISGLGFTPSFVWLDENDALFALSGGWMGLLPEGNTELFDALRARQDQAETAHLRDTAQRLTERLPERWCLTNARWLDVDAGRLQPAATLLVRRGVIEAIGDE